MNTSGAAPYYQKKNQKPKQTPPPKFPSFLYITTFILDFHSTLHSTTAPFSDKTLLTHISSDLQPCYHTCKTNNTNMF